MTPAAGQLWRTMATGRRVVVIETMGNWVSWRWERCSIRQPPLRVDEWVDMFRPDEEFN